MKTSSLLLVLAAAPVLAGDPAPKVIDLGDGSSVKIEDGKVEVHASGSSSGNGSNSRSVSSTTTTDADGNTVTTIISEHNGVRETKTITTGPDGKVSVKDGDAKPAAPDKMGKPKDEADADAPKDDKAAEAANSGGWLGVHTVPVPEATRAQVDIPEGEGILIEFIAEDGPAAKAGLAENDILLRLNNAGIKDVPSFRDSLRKSRPGEQIRLDYLRKGKSGSVMVTLAPRPKDADSGNEGNEAEDQSKGTSSSSKRTVIVDADGKVRILEGDGADDAFESLLKDPNVPAEMKKHIEDARKKMKELMPKVDK